MRLLYICVALFFITCNSFKKKELQTLKLSTSIKKDCLDTLNFKNKESVFSKAFSVNKLNSSPFKIIKATITDSISTDLISTIEKTKLIEAISKITFIKYDDLKTVTSNSPECGLFLDNKSNDNLLNTGYNFFIQDGFKLIKGKDKETSILQKYIDSSATLFESEPFYVDQGSVFEIDIKEKEYISTNYETYSNDGGEFITTYKILDILNYNPDGWLKSVTSYRSFYKNYFSEENRFINKEDDETLDTIRQYTFIETKLDKDNSFIESINIYHIELDDIELSQQPFFSIKKHIVLFSPQS